MATEFTVMLEDQPGTLASLTEALSKNGVNITAIHATPCPASQGIVQFITNNTDATVNALNMAGLDYTTHQVLVISIPDEPGTLARLTRDIAAARININAIYHTTTGQLVINANDLEGLQKATLELGLQ